MQATYPLTLIKKLVESGSYLITNVAAQSGKSDFGFDQYEILKHIKALKASEFYKTMPSEKISGLWQDVYRQSLTINGTTAFAYVKLQVNEFLGGQKAVVISYKLL
jgi:hypothetical protein